MEPSVRPQHSSHIISQNVGDGVPPAIFGLHEAIWCATPVAQSSRLEQGGEVERQQDAVVHAWDDLKEERNRKVVTDAFAVLQRTSRWDANDTSDPYYELEGEVEALDGFLAGASAFAPPESVALIMKQIDLIKSLERDLGVVGRYGQLTSILESLEL